MVQELLLQDFALRQAACETIIERPQDEIVVVSGTNHRELHQKPLNSESVTVVWCGFSKVEVIGPYIFEEINHTGQ